MAAGARVVSKRMKTTVSIPDELVEKVDRLARRQRRARSEIFSAALLEYVDRHLPDPVTEAMNRVCDGIDQSEDIEILKAAAYRIFKKNEW
jgi:metal-responsive CopG/Arc/MetJ family transcriptional regulator